MKSNWLFYLGVTINAFMILIGASSALIMHKNFDDTLGTNLSPIENMTNWGRSMIWFIPLILLAMIWRSFWFKSNGKILLANILLWIPALPMLIMILLWGGLALIFILFGK